MALSRRHETYSTNGVEVSYDDVSWEYVRDRRNKALANTDLWYLSDRWAKLSTTAKGELNTYRQTLRDVPQNYNEPNDAADNFPIAEDWFMDD